MLLLTRPMPAGAREGSPPGGGGGGGGGPPIPMPGGGGGGGGGGGISARLAYSRPKAVTVQDLSGVSDAALFSQVPDQKPGGELVTRLSKVGRAGGQVRLSSTVHERGEDADEKADRGWDR